MPIPYFVIILLGWDLMIESIEVIKKNGVVYTPSSLAQYVAEKVIEYFFDSLTKNPNKHYDRSIYNSILRNIKIIDPACGDGELLVAVWKALNQKLANIFNHNDTLPNPVHALCGIDFDQNAILMTERRIKALSNVNTISGELNLISTNSLCPFDQESFNLGWEEIKKRFNAKHGFDILIANPPWGADISSYESRLSPKEFSLYKGQFDTSDLFVELALSIIKPGGYFAFIIPDSLFSYERASLRKKILEETEIKFIGRFGEKIFKNINRGTAVLIGSNHKPNRKATVDCIRMTPTFRKKILQGDATFGDAERKLQHKVPQDRFANNKDFLFDIYLREDEQQTLHRLSDCKATFRDFLFNARGVELSKYGKICRCNFCGLWLPYPNPAHPRCPHCKSALVLSHTDKCNIINKKYLRGYEPIIVGENIKRYCVTSPYWIVTNKVGINYKNRSIYSGSKIVVRKTGVGLLAAIDYQNSLTNQVVYIFKTKDDHNSHFPIELFLAIMNSRMMYYYLVKSYGETEWRSHPYLTQKQILDLPMFTKDSSLGSYTKIVDNITQLLKSYLLDQSDLPPDIDARVEYLVAKLYGLSRDDYKYIFDTLEEVEELIPVKCLKKITINDIFSFGQ